MTTEMFDIVHASSEDVAKYNETHKLEIEHGVRLPRKQSDRAIEEEKKRKEIDDVQAKRSKQALEIFQQLDPKVGKPSNVWHNRYDARTHDDITLRIKEHGRIGSYKGGYFKLEIDGGYHNETWMRIGTEGCLLCLTPQQLVKANEKLASVRNIKKLRMNTDAELARTRQRKIKLLQDAKNRTVLVLVSGHTYPAEYDSWWTVGEDGRLTTGGHTLEMAEWQQVADMKLRHAKELKALFESFA